MDNEAKEIIKKLSSLNWSSDNLVKDISTKERQLEALQKELNESKETFNNTLKEIETLSAKLIALLTPPVPEPIVISEPTVVPEDQTDQIGRDE
jgi:SMC interacting uncharacterized protein involved in chromosome segregation